MSGLPEVDMDDWEKNTTYANGYDAECPVIVVSTSAYSQVDYINVERRPWITLDFHKIKTSSTFLCVFLVVLESSAIVVQD